MTGDIPLTPGQDAFPNHVFDALGAPPIVLEKRIGGSVMVVEKRPPGGPITLITAGVGRLPVDRGLPVELAVEVVDGQQGAGLVALTIVCDDVAQNRRTPPVGAPWRNTEPFLTGTRITAIVAGGSRWGSTFDDVRDEAGVVVGHVRTLRLLTDTEAAVVAERGWDALTHAAGSLDSLLDVMREGVVPDGAASGPTTTGAPAVQAVIRSKLHEQHPPRWLTLSQGMLQSVTGLESPEYMADSTNHEIVSLESYLARFPWTRAFVDAAEEGQSALFTDASGRYTLEG